MIDGLQLILYQKRLIYISNLTHFIEFEFSNILGRYSNPQIPCDHALKTQDLAGTLVDKQTPSPQQVPDRSQIFKVNYNWYYCSCCYN